MGPRVAFTFDTEPGESHPHHSLREDGWREILDILDEEGSKATFFIIGSWALAQPELTRRTVAGGHLVGNHSRSHVPLGEHPDQTAIQVLGAEEDISSLCGRSTKPWFRLPYLNGDSNDEIAQALAGLGYEHVRENCDSQDWNDAVVPTPDSVVRRVIDQAAGKDPIVVLMHSWPKTTPTALRELISHFKKEGAAFVTVAELTADERAALPTARP